MVQVENKEKNRKKKWVEYGVFSLFFLIAFFAVFMPLIASGHSFLRINGDNYNQYFTTLTYYRSLIGKCVSAILAGDFSAIPLWDMSIGYGSDILTTLNYYGVGDPLNLLVVLFQEEHLEICFAIILGIRLYLGGLFFYIFSRNHGNQLISSYLGAALYAFCGFSLYYVMRYPAFGIAIMLLPLMFLAIDRAVQRQKYGMLSIVTFVGFISNFYLMFSICIASLSYGIYLLVCIYKDGSQRGIKEYIISKLGTIGRCILGAIIGVLLAMPILLPSALVLVSNERALMEKSELLYPWIYYPKLFVHLFWGIDLNMLGLSVILIPILVWVFLSEKKIRYKLLVIILGVMLLLPFFGSFMNGMNYVTDRWQYIVSFAMAFLIAKYLPQIGSMKKWPIIAAILLMIVVSGIGQVLSDTPVLILHIISVAMAVVLICRAKIPSRYFQLILGVLCLISVIYCAHDAIKRDGTVASSSNYRGIGETNSWEKGLLGDYAKYLEQFKEDTTFERFSYLEPCLLPNKNGAVVNSLYGSQYYYSLNNQSVADFYKDMGISSEKVYDYSGVDGRSILLSRLEIKYLVSDGSSEKHVPLYDSKQVIGDDIGATDEAGVTVIYQSDCSSLSYVPERICNQTVWDELSAVERETYLLYGAYIPSDMEIVSNGLILSDQRNATDIKKEMEGYQMVIPFSLEMSNNMVSEHGINVSDCSDEVVLNLENVNEISGELFLEFDNLDFDDTHSAYCEIKVISGEVIDTGLVVSRKADYYVGARDHVFYLGYFEHIPETMSIQFDHVGTFTFDDMKVVRRSIDNMADIIQKSNEGTLTDIRVFGNGISGDVSAPDGELLCIAIPYSSGWNCYIDGSQVDILRANDMMLAVDIPQGKHIVELRYQTPGVFAGWICFGIGVVLLSAFAIVDLSRKQRKSKDSL